MGMKPKANAEQAPAATDDFAATEPPEHLEWRGRVEDFLARLCVPDAALTTQANAQAHVAMICRGVSSDDARAVADRWLADRLALRDEVRRRVALPEPAHWLDVAAHACRLRPLIDDLIARDYLPQRPATSWRMPAGEVAKVQAKPKRTTSLADVLKRAGVA